MSDYQDYSEPCPECLEACAMEAVVDGLKALGGLLEICMGEPEPEPLVQWWQARYAEMIAAEDFFEPEPEPEPSKKTPVDWSRNGF